MRLRNFTALAVVLVALASGCTRGTSNSGSMKLTFNSSSGNGAQSLTGNLNFAVVNVHLPTGPVVREFEFEDDPIPAGQGFELVIPNVPKGTFLVQFLGIYESDGQPGKFAYGDAMAVTTVPNPEVTITTAEIGTFAKEGRVSGRYLRQAGEPAGPTGDLIMQFQPPDTSKPKMNIHPFPMVQGYFSLMVLDGAKLDYMLLPGREVLFKGVTINPAGDLVIDNVVQTPSNALMKVEVPAHFRADSGDGDIESMPPTVKWIGFLKHADVPVAELTNKKVCYANDIEEAVPGAFRSLISGVLSNPLEINLTGSPSAIQVRRIAGGVADSQAAIYTGSSSPCTALPENKMTIQHAQLSDDHDDGPGMSPPFSAVRPFSRWDQFISSSYSAAGPAIKLQWKYLPGISASSLDGVVILAKSSNGGGGGGDKRCDDLLKQGYGEVGVTSTVAQDNFIFNSAALNSSNKFSWEFALCGYKNVDGSRKYVGRPVRGGRIGGDEGVVHTGWAKASAVASPTGTVQYVLEGGSEEKVFNIDSTPALYTTLLYLGSITALPGDEVMFTIVGKNASCGAHNGDPNDIGKFGFARVISNVGGTMKVSKGSFIDQMDETLVNAHLAENILTNSFCHLRAVRVLHYRDLNLSGATSFIYNSGNSPFNYADSGGHFAIRVNGLLTLGAVFSSSGAGFKGGTSTLATGAGSTGPSVATGSNGTGGQGHVNGGSGGSCRGSGSGAASGASATPSLPGGGYGGFGKLLLGGGGGLGGSSEMGGDGGGAIFMMARETSVSSVSVMDSSGADGMGTSGGGGAGGSVLFYTGKLSGAGSLSILANGGSGASGTSGVGGGGQISAMACAGTGAISVTAAAGTVGALGASAGEANLYDPANQEYLCRSLK